MIQGLLVFEDDLFSMFLSASRNWNTANLWLMALHPFTPLMKPSPVDGSKKSVLRMTFFWLWDLRASSIWRWDCTVFAASRQVGILLACNDEIVMFQKLKVFEFIPGRFDVLIVSNRPCHDWRKISGSWFARGGPQLSMYSCSELWKRTGKGGGWHGHSDYDVFGFFWMNSGKSMNCLWCKCSSRCTQPHIIWNPILAWHVWVL